MPQPDIDQYKESLAEFLARKDAVQFGMTGEDPNLIRSWDDVPEMGREEYLNDAEVTLKALMLMGWAPAKLVQHQLLDGMATTIRRDPQMPAGIKRGLTKWIKDLKKEIDK